MAGAAGWLGRETGHSAATTFLDRQNQGAGPDRALYSTQICGEIPQEKLVKDRGTVLVWVYVSANHWLDCAYLSTAAADFVVANRDKLSGVKKPRKCAADYSSRPRSDDRSSAYAARPSAGFFT